MNFLTELLKGLTEKDRFIQAFHWGLVLCVVLNLFIIEAGDGRPHDIIGYLASALIMARFIWGFFQKTPISGPNILAIGNMYFMLACVLALGVSGFLMGTDQFFGEEWVEITHEYLGYALQASILVHLAGVLKATLTPVVADPLEGA